MNLGFIMGNAIASITFALIIFVLIVVVGSALNVFSNREDYKDIDSNMEDLCAENAALKAEVEKLKQENKKAVQENIKLKEQLFENQNKNTNQLTQNL